MKKFSSTKKASSRLNFSVNPTVRVGIVLLIVAVFLMVIVPWVLPVVARVLLAPVHAVATWVRESPGVLPAYLRDRTALLEEKTALQIKIDSQVGLEHTVERLIEENISLRSYHGEGQPERILTRVIARPPFLPYDRIQIDKGSEAGVVVGAPVFAGKDVVIGGVVDVGTRYAFVEVVTSPDFLTTVYVPAAQAFATMEGRGGGVARVRFPQGVRIEVGNQVLLPAYDGGVYGEVVSIESSPTQPEQYAYLTLPVPLQSMRYLTVGREPVTPRTPADITDTTKQLLRSFFVVPEVNTFITATSTDPVTGETVPSFVASSTATTTGSTPITP